MSQAQQYLDRKEAKRADQELQRAERQMQRLTQLVGSDLAQAMRNLWLAFQNYSTSRIQEARKYLKISKTHLDKTANMGNRWERSEAASLSGEIYKLDNKLNSRETGVEMLLKSAWERNKALVERSAEYLASGWTEAETTLKGENNLIEAKLHVAYAETYQVTTHEPEKALGELDKALSYLGKEAKDRLADKASQKKVNDVVIEVTALKANPEKNDFSVQDRYDNIRILLNRLIQEL